MAENNLKYYDAHCPNCRRANRVERIKLEASHPGWREELKTLAKQARQAEAAAPQENETGLVKPPKEKTAVVPAKPVANTKTTPAMDTSPAPAKKKPASGKKK